MNNTMLVWVLLAYVATRMIDYIARSDSPKASQISAGLTLLVVIFAAIAAFSQ